MLATTRRLELVDPDTQYARRWWTLAVLCLSLVLIIVANSSLYIALPSLVEDLGATQSELQWIVDIYALVFGGLLLPCAAIGDRFGRKGVLQIGLVFFASASAVGTLADSPTQLIVIRAVMGVGAALIMPSTLSILANVFQGQERGTAIGIWAGVAGVGGALGPTITGLLLKHFWWGSIFLINVPIAIIALVAGWILVPTSRDPHPRRLDPLGAALSSFGLAALIFGIIEAPDRGWGDTMVLTSLFAALVLLGSFVAWELHIREPMLELRLFRDPGFAVGSGTIASAYFVVFGMTFLTVQFFQSVQGYDPFGGGIRTLPISLTLMLVAPRTAKLSARWGPGRVVAVGLSTLALGLLMLATINAHTSFLVVATYFFLLGVGIGLTVAPSTTAIMAAVPPAQAGMGSAVNDTTREVGSALGIAVLGTIHAIAYRSALDPALAGLSTEATERARSSVGGALQVAGDLSGPESVRLSDAARDAFMAGWRPACFVVAAIALAGAALNEVVINGRTKRARAARLAGADALTIDAVDDPALDGAVLE